MTREKTELAILFADVCGSSRLYEVLGDRAAQDRIASALSQMAEATTRQRGTVVKSIGDEIMCTFPTADAALAAAREMNEAVDRMPPLGVPDAPPFNIHAGFHFGPVVREEGDVFGDAVNVAARVVAMADPRQILTTGQTVRRLALGSREAAHRVDQTTLKGMTGPVDICEIPWEEVEVTLEPDPSTAPGLAQTGSTAARLTLALGERQVCVDAAHPRAALGRHAQNDLQVESPHVSRYHAKIEFRRGRFYLVDQSSYGTYLREEGGAERFLKREEAPLQGAGTIGLGEAIRPDSPTAVSYRIDA
jgi:class 3 adenylate cyclase